MPSRDSVGESEPGLRVGVRSRDLSEARLRYLAQLGVEDVFVDQTTRAGPDRLAVAVDDVPTPGRLVQARTRLEAAGLRLAGIQSLSFPVVADVMFDRDGSEEALAALKRLVHNMGEAGIPLLGYHWTPLVGPVPMRTSHAHRVRGGATATAFDLADLADPESPTDPSLPEAAYEESELWANYERFLEELVPVAEEAGVTLALHPADPPVVERLEGVPRLFRSVENCERAMELVESPNHAMKLCLGTFSSAGADAVDVVRRFGARDEIAFVHFRDVVGSMPAFHETFVDDPAGNFDEVAVVDALREVGFDGVIVPDHVPAVEGDTEWGHRARGHACGYLQGLLAATDA